MNYFTYIYLSEYEQDAYIIAKNYKEINSQLENILKDYSFIGHDFQNDINTLLLLLDALREYASVDYKMLEMSTKAYNNFNYNLVHVCNKYGIAIIRGQQ